MKGWKYFIIIFSIVIVVTASALFLINPEDKVYEMLTEDEIAIIKGEKFQIEPMLQDQKGKKYDGVYSYSSSNEDLVNVDEEGNVTINENSSILNYEDVYVNVKEESTNTVKRIKVNIVFDLNDVFSFSSIDNPNEKVQKMTIGRTYMFEVSTLPKEFSVEDFFDLKAYDSDGSIKDVFDIKFDKNIVSLTPTGIGEGKFVVNIVNEKFDLNFEEDVEFFINYYETSLTNDILSSSSKSLLSSKELKKLDSLYLSSDLLKIDENFNKTFDLSNIKKIILLNENFVNIEYLSDSVTLNNLKNINFRVSGDLFFDYLNDENWKIFSNNIIPYSYELMDYNDQYVVYHYSNDVDSTSVFDNNLVMFSKMNVNSLQLFAKYVGYTQVAWKDRYNKEVKDLSSYSDGLHLWAVWNANKYKIVLKGSGLIDDSEYEVEYNSLVNVPTPLDYNGWEFAGWYKDETFAVKYENNKKYENLSDTTLYAKWTTKVVLNYGDNSIEGKDYELIEDFIYGSQLDLSKLSTTRNWEFAGWFTEKFGKGEEMQSGEYKGKGNVTFYAKWVYELYLSYYDHEFEIERFENIKNNAIKLVHGLSMEESAIKLINNEVIDENWVLENWYTKANGQGSIVDSSKIVKISDYVNYDTGEKLIDTIYAHYKSHAYFMDGEDIKYQIDIYYNDVINPNIYDYMEKVEKEGYVFLDWFYVNNLDEMIIFPRTEDKPNRNWTVTCTKKIGNVKFVANYEAIKYEVSYDLDGGIASNNIDLDLEVSYDESFALPTDISKLGYTFTNWRIIKIGENEVSEDVNTDTLINITSKNLDKVLIKAVWEANEYNFVLNGQGLAEDSELEITYDNEMNLPVYSSVGVWEFAGWYEDSEYIKEVESICNYVYGENEEEINLYAKWTTTLTFDYDFDDFEDVIIENVVYGKDLEISELNTNIEGWCVNGWYSDRSGQGTQLNITDNTISQFVYDFNYVYPKLECVASIKYDYLGIDKSGDWEEEITLVKGLNFNYDELPNISDFEDEDFQNDWTLSKWTSESLGNGTEISSTLVVNEIISEIHPYFISKIKLCSSVNDGIEKEIGIVLGSKIKLFEDEIISLFDVDYRQLFYAWKYDENVITAVNFEIKNYNLVDKNMANREYNALYKEGMYTIKYSYVNEKGKTVTVQKKYSLLDDAFITLEAPEKVGYTFSVWENEELELNENQEYETFASEIGEVINLNAKWEENAYTIDYVVSEGIEDIDNQELTYTESANLCTIDDVKTGYIFIGWSKTEDRENVDFDLSTEITKLSEINEGIVYLYDCWKPITYFINLYNEDQLIDRIEKLYSDEEYVLDVMNLKGYTFVSWKDSENNELIIGESVDKLTNDQEEVNLYGTWLENSYKLNLYNGEELCNTLTLSYSQEISVEDVIGKELEKLGYYYNSIIDKEGNQYSLKQDISKLTSENNKEVDLFINWQAIKFTFFFEDYDDENGALLLSIKYDQSFKLEGKSILPDESDVPKYNFNFKGWYLDSAYSKELTSDTLVSEIVTIDNFESIKNNNYRIKVYGKYTSKVYLNSPVNNQYSILEVVYGEIVSLPSYLTCDGWEFKAWYTSENYYDFEKVGVYSNNNISYQINKDSGNIKLYAKWISNTNLYTFKDRKIEQTIIEDVKLIYGWKLKDIFLYNNLDRDPLGIDANWDVSVYSDVYYSFDDSIKKAYEQMFLNYSSNVQTRNTVIDDYSYTVKIYIDSYKNIDIYLDDALNNNTNKINSIYSYYYYFDRWTMDLVGKENVNVDSLLMKTADKVLYSQWNQVYSDYVYITSVSEFLSIKSNLSGKYMLLKNICLDGKSSSLPFANFSGVLDGQGKTICHMMIDKTGTKLNSSIYLGLFVSVSGTVRNMVFSGCTISVGSNHEGSGYIYAGILAGYITPYGKVDNVKVNGSSVNVHRHLSHYGMISGTCDGKITNCIVSDSSMYGNGVFGGISGGLNGVSANVGLISGCKVQNTKIHLYGVESGTFSGGIVGFSNTGTIQNCTVYKNQYFIECSSADASKTVTPGQGYIAGKLDNSTMSGCTNSGGCTKDSQNFLEDWKGGFLNLKTFYNNNYFDHDNGLVGCK